MSNIPTATAIPMDDQNGRAKAVPVNVNISGCQFDKSYIKYILISLAIVGVFVIAIVLIGVFANNNDNIIIHDNKTSNNLRDNNLIILKDNEITTIPTTTVTTTTINKECEIITDKNICVSNQLCSWDIKKYKCFKKFERLDNFIDTCSDKFTTIKNKNDCQLSSKLFNFKIMMLLL